MTFEMRMPQSVAEMSVDKLRTEDAAVEVPEGAFRFSSPELFRETLERVIGIEINGGTQ